MWTLPGASRFVDEIADHLASGTSVVIALPDTMDAGSVRREVSNRLSGSRTLPLPAPSEPDAVRVLDLLGVSREDRGSEAIDDVVALESLSSTILWFENETQAEREPDLSSWRTFIKDWSVASRTSDSLLAPTLAVCIGGAEALAIGLDEPAMTTAYWWGCLHRIDTDLYLHTHARHRPMLHRAMSAEVALFDPHLALALADERWADVRELQEILSGLGPSEAPASPRAKVGEHPSTAQCPDWAAGRIDRFDDHTEPMMHASCLCENLDALNVRCWRGQVRSVLPQLEELRRQVIGRAKAEGYIAQSVPATDLDFGPLTERLLADAPPRTSRSELGILARDLRSARNRIAHLEPISATSFDRILESAIFLGLD